MKTKELAPLIIDACIDYLHGREIGSKYRPEKETYFIDTKLMARILRHNGNLQAQVTQDETLLMNKFLKILVEKKIFNSILTDNKYSVEEKQNGKKLSIIVKRINTLTLRGRKPKFMGVKNGIREHKECKTNI